ncbi:MAG: 16S rRNA (adenine(1518)-N(6)/adenine(1519)-N(6))-dimethyltransferase RsmA [Fidelibacterota bacterium]|nr:MAG: 16S rRNA (adenine(1518)-N(6)/adenine(1519)-N(6))-dimethyltransferase RsmA [Candidatus Neomarinimicrobiota bacterium]
MAADERLPRPPARKRWGQNFLTDPNLIRKIVATIDPQPDDSFLEIGPGHGELTIPLAQQAGRVTAVDIDPLLVEPLRQAVPPNVTVIQDDILKVNLPAVLPVGCRIYGSLPYNITSPILFRLLEQRSRWRDAHFIVQREVADRMAAAPGSKVYGRLSVMVQAFTKVSKCFDLPPTVFRPRPKVSSALVHLEPAEQHGTIEDEELFARVVRRAFGQRRKKLANALKPLEAGELLAELGLADLRAEEVVVDGYLEIVRRLVG